MPLFSKWAAIICLFSAPIFAANHYVRQGASGNGTDWTNACADFTGSCAVGSLVRGDTYYVADGSYAGRSFNTPTSGSTYITIKKATATDHGTDTGWLSTYGDSQAIITGQNSINSGYWDFNGQFGSGTGLYGFKFDFSEGQEAVSIGNAANVKLQYIDFDGISTTGNHNYSAATRALTIGRGTSSLLVSHTSMHGCESCIQEGDGNLSNGFDSTGTIVEYTLFYNSRSTSSNYHNNIYYCTGSSNGTFRYNTVHDYNDEGLFFTWWEGSPSGWKVYGNVFWSDGGEQNPRGIEIRQDGGYSGIEIYNNTFVNLGTGGFLNRAPESGGFHCTNCIARNNLSYKSPNTTGDMTTSNNTDDGTNRFVNLSGKDFHLTAALAGGALNSPYDADMDGKGRGSDGVWDRGAYEFGGKPASSTCDVNGDGSITNADVTASLNSVLGTASCVADLDGNGTCNVVDVQRIINASLGQSCRTGQ